MRYVSTRSRHDLGTFCEVLLSGLAPDGGLAMPEQWPHFSAAEIESWRGLRYDELAFRILSPFISDIPADDLRALLAQTYTAARFGSEDITPLFALDANLYLLELSNGPSLAFKDMAMQFLGAVFEYVLARRDAQLNILGATSGDTGSAAEYAMLGKARVKVFMLSPHGRMSAFQRAQMYSLDAPNIFNLAIRGVFDDCQDLVKTLNQDAEFKARWHLGAVNSINWARVLAQTVYYFKAYLALPTPQPLDFCVPSGNFGNVFAGYLAKKMGLPIAHLLVATNENDVLHDFFSSGRYRVRPATQVAKTSSPSMDIGKASNFERFLYLISGEDGAQVRHWYEALAQGQTLDLRATPFWAEVEASGFGSGRSCHQDRLAQMRAVFQRTGRVIDPHTADGVQVARMFEEAGGGFHRPMICLETALAVKFSETVTEALAQEVAPPEALRGIEEKPQHFTVLDNDADALKAFIARNG